jgi:protease IV
VDVLERDFYEERRRKWRRSAFWRGFLVAAALAVVSFWAFAGGLPAGGDQIARFELNGVIVDDARRDRLFEDIAEDDDVKALILRISSPGGTTVGSEAIFEGVRAVAARKPVVAVLGEVAASGGYVAAIAADHIIGRGNTLTGSVGVILEYPDFTDVMARIGVGLETVRSSELKAEPSPFRPTNPAARIVEEALVADSYQWFRGLVEERRGLSGGELDAVANGAIFTGRLALEKRMIDAIGGERQALEWLESRDGALEDLPVRDWMLEEDDGVLGGMVGSLASTSGILREISQLWGVKLYSIAP